MIRLLAVTVAIALWAAPAYSGGIIDYSSNGFMDACRELARSGGSFRSRDADFNAGECMGFIEGVLDTTFRYVTPTGHCIPHEVIMGQIIRVVVQYVDARPVRAHEAFAVLVTEALRDAWPCKR
jgi:hypothetical protein